MKFYSQNYLVLTAVGWINVLNLRFGPDYTDSENYSSLLAVLLSLFSIAYPVFIVIFYLQSYKPLLPPFIIEEGKNIE
jgi:hypothetical protein